MLQLNFNTSALSVASTFSPGGRFLAYASSDEKFKLLDVGFGKDLLTIKCTSATCSVMAVSPDGKLLASGFIDGTVVLFNIVCSEKKYGTSWGHSTQITSLVFLRDG